MKGIAVPDFLIPFLVDIQKGIREKTLEVESNDFEKLLGRSATSISEGLTQIVKGLS
jgi:NAD(P)H dehydrogenase (quinone)